jgi:hypothetical protein
LAISIVGEGDIDAAVATRLLRDHGLESGPVHITRGKARLDRQLDGYVKAAAYGKWLVLRDLDEDAGCAPDFLRGRATTAGPGMALRIAVRSVESWILADRESAARLLGVRVGRVPERPDELPNPKQWIIEQARHARSRRVRALAPAPGMSARVGPGYTSTMLEHVSSAWNPRTASAVSPSLARCLAANDRLGATP